MVTSNDITVLSTPNPLLWKNTEWRQYTSIDPAFKNIGLRIERRWYNSETNKCNKIQMVHFERINIVDESIPLVKKLQETLDGLHEKFKESHFFLIERQQPISARGQVHTNSKVMRVFGHICAYFMTRYGGDGIHPLICEVNPKLKGKILEFPPDLTYAQTKSMGVKIGTQILTNAGDLMGLAVIKAAGSKKDDLTDTVCQIEAFERCFYDFNNNKIKGT